MPRKRTPLAIARLTGQDKVHRERFRDRREPEPTGELGDPSDALNSAEKKALNDFRSAWPWLNRGDQASMVPLRRMRAKIEDQNSFPTVSLLNAYRLMLHEHGGTPTSRTKIYQPKMPDEDEFAAFDCP